VALSNIKPLDGVRTIAIGLVLFWHYIICEISGDLGLHKISFWTWSGVDLFFVLSGFLIGRILIYNKASKNFFKTFYARRFLRIFPAYYLVLLAFFIFVKSGTSVNFPWLAQEPFPLYSYALYIQNFFMMYSSTGPNWLGVTWSLAAEEQFYLLLPLVIFLVNYKNLPWAIIIGILLGPIFRATLPGLGPYVLLPARIDSLMFGVLIAYYHLNGSLEKAFKKRQGMLVGCIIVFFLLLYVFGAKKPMGGIGDVYLHTVLAMFYASFLILVLVADKNSGLSKFLSAPWMSFIAKISYMIYLTHQIFNGLFSEIFMHRQTPQMSELDGALTTLGAFIATLAFSTLSYYILEKPILNLGKKFTY
jgi:peptidoglycan/LPS O-acetylase OafA/YrhL